jgi:NAD(P)H-hydrate repair Nnr-like enzyme with NAD(P)H-hydrate epimerase domain
MALLHRIAAEGQTRLHVVKENRESGQGTLEYVGIAVLIGIIVAALLGAGFDDKLKEAVDKVIQKITTGN